MKSAYAANDVVRSEGSRNLLAAAAAAGARRYLAQNVCFLYAPEGERIKRETDRLFTDAPEPFGRTIRLSAEMDENITGSDKIEGLVLRFGFWYGPGTSFAPDGYTASEVKKRRFPIVGDGGGVYSFIHIDDVVEATLAAMERGAAGVYNVCDDEPAPMSEWIPAYAKALGAKPPRRVPRFLARLITGSYIALMATELRGASNAKAKRELGWAPRYPSWREGFTDG
jgi:nucleoside-diphosphate-sugar epimerase